MVGLKQVCSNYRKKPVAGSNPASPTILTELKGAGKGYAGCKDCEKIRNSRMSLPTDELQNRR